MPIEIPVVTVTSHSMLRSNVSCGTRELTLQAVDQLTVPFFESSGNVDPDAVTDQYVT